MTALAELDVPQWDYTDETITGPRFHEVMLGCAHGRDPDESWSPHPSLPTRPIAGMLEPEVPQVLCPSHTGCGLGLTAVGRAYSTCGTLPVWSAGASRRRF